MICDPRAEALEALSAAVGEERVHTVRVCFSDHYGVLRGRRLAAEHFLADVHARQAFCDGALVWDIRCDIFETPDFSNYGTGYPDLYVRPDLGTLRPCGWADGEYVVLGDVQDHHGDPIAVDPRTVLRTVVDRIGADVAVGARLELRVPDEAAAAAWAPGHGGAFADHLLAGLEDAELPLLALEWCRPERVLALSFEATPAITAADVLVLARTAAREAALAHGVQLTAMPRLRDDDRPAALRLTVDAPQPALADADPALERLADVELLLRPLPLAYAGTALGRRSSGRLEAAAASDANPYLAVAGALLAVWGEGAGTGLGGASYAAAIARLRDAAWAGEWVDPGFRHDALALAEREAALRERAVTAWDRDRYWSCG